jgi:hypothetical protein
MKNKNAAAQQIRQAEMNPGILTPFGGRCCKQDIKSL